MSATVHSAPAQLSESVSAGKDFLPLKGTDHATPYTYDTHVPLAFYGLPFQPGAYRTHAEPVDLAATLASLLGINAPTHSVGRVLIEALAPHHAGNSAGNSEPVESSPRESPPGGSQP